MFRKSLILSASMASKICQRAPGTSYTSRTRLLVIMSHPALSIDCRAALSCMAFPPGPSSGIPTNTITLTASETSRCRLVVPSAGKSAEPKKNV